MTQGELVIMGPPGSGKGTQAQRIAALPGWVHLSTGDLFRKNLSEGTPLGALAERYMSKGAYVPDDITVGMVRDRMREIPRSERVVFDGFPRTVAQAEALDTLLAELGRRVTSVVLIDVDRDQLVARLTSRAQGRSDDRPDVISTRFDVYEGQTRPVVEHYERKGLVRHVNGVGSVDDVHARVRAAAA